MFKKISLALLIVFFVLAILYFINLKLHTVEGMSGNTSDDDDSSGNIKECNYSTVNKTIDEIQDTVTKNTDAIQQIQEQMEQMDSS